MTVDNLPAKIRVAQIADHKVVRDRFRERVEFKIDPPNPKPLLFQTFHEVASNEPAGSQNEC